MLVVGLVLSISTGFGCDSLSFGFVALGAGEGDANVGVTLQ